MQFNCRILDSINSYSNFCNPLPKQIQSNVKLK